ncbi:hypothetical protein BH11ACT7_BH11ACT7_38990 [soil metagenome]
MTALGAALYIGLFALAALWLFVTNDDSPAEGQAQRQDLSKSNNFSAGSLVSSSMLVSHSSQK